MAVGSRRGREYKKSGYGEGLSNIIIIFVFGIQSLCSSGLHHGLIKKDGGC